MQLDVQRLRNTRLVAMPILVKIVAVYTFIFVILSALVPLVAFVMMPAGKLIGFIIFSLLFIPLAIILAVVGKKLWSAAKHLEKLKHEEDPYALYWTLEDLIAYAKWSSMFYITAVVIAILMIILLVVLAVVFSIGIPAGSSFTP
ncbi:MAG: hypothetical protein GXO39_04840 [Thermotogae bacterium]|nr:hypothetical protein [Thermotogota bacterium]